MILRSLRLKNFMPYRGEHKIDFRVAGNRNVTVIYGDNMRGKTSLLNGLRWALYGEVLGRHLKKIPLRDILNKDAAHERDFVVQAGLTFEHRGSEYEIVRTLRPKSLIDTPRDDDHFEESCTMRRQGVPVSAHLIESEINHILPESIARFSLFDGELLQEYEQLVADATEQSDKIRDAIEKTLGVPALLNGRAHVAELLHRAQKQFTKEGLKGSQHGKLEQQTQTELEDARRELSRLQELHSSATAEAEEIGDKLTNLSRAEGVKARIEESQRQRERATAARDRALSRRRELAPKAWLALITSSLMARREEVELELGDASSRLQAISENRVVARLRAESASAGKCGICAQALSEEAAAALREPMDDSGHTSFDHVANVVAELSRNLSRLRTLGGTDVRSEITQAEREFDRSTVDINRFQAREDELLAQIPGVDLSELGRLTERRDSLQREIGRQTTLIAAQQTKCTSLQKKYDVLVNNAAGGQHGATQQIALKVRLLSALSEIFEKSIENLRHKLRDVVEKSATATFKRLTTEKHYRGLVINDRYGLEIRDHLDRLVSVRSAGAEQIVALSLIDGLSHASGGAGVLVMDTPFGRLDLKHRAEVLGYLPKMAQQVVLLVHEGELSKDRDLVHINDYVAASYEIERLSPTQSTIEKR